MCLLCYVSVQSVESVSYHMAFIFLLGAVLLTKLPAVCVLQYSILYFYIQGEVKIVNSFSLDNCFLFQLCFNIYFSLDL